MVWNIGSVNEHEFQSAIITFIDIEYEKNMSCDNNATSFLLVDTFRH
jgi:hypothetical protein